MRKIYRLVLASLFLVIVFGLTQTPVRADLVDDLKSKIDERNKVIADLEKEIAEYQVEVEKTGAQAKNLKNKIASLELTRKKLSAEISVIQNKISSATLTIRKLDSQIVDAEATIKRTLDGIAVTIRETNMEESNSFVETLLNYQKISTFLDKVESLENLNQGLKAALAEVQEAKAELEAKNIEAQGKRRELRALAGDLSDKKKVAEYNKTQTTKVFNDTKNKQSNFQKILNEKIALRNAFERELLKYESELKFAIDPTSLPSIGSGVLKWPLAKVKITQEFGDTAFARTGAYKGQGHNGIDFAAAIGTPIKAALQGEVKGVGDTDKVCPGASYGRWVLVEHPNGLSTLYAHFSIVKVVTGQHVDTGEVLGYAGETGYATGPHLHFTVYATQGVKIITRKSTVCQGSYTMPVASLNAYLNPMSYL
ncbi:MAG: peptidoglycan DD-metalloendopeptidase family protein [bacterium]|nr:peptidoglycan DD-metalloendopeptidase family protein [bacterium]